MITRPAARPPVLALSLLCAGCAGSSGASDDGTEVAEPAAVAPAAIEPETIEPATAVPENTEPPLEELVAQPDTAPSEGSEVDASPADVAPPELLPADVEAGDAGPSRGGPAEVGTPDASSPCGGPQAIEEQPPAWAPTGPFEATDPSLLEWTWDGPELLGAPAGFVVDVVDAVDDAPAHDDLPLKAWLLTAEALGCPLEPRTFADAMALFEDVAAPDCLPSQSAFRQAILEALPSLECALEGLAQRPTTVWRLPAIDYGEYTERALVIEDPLLGAFEAREWTSQGPNGAGQGGPAPVGIYLHGHGGWDATGASSYDISGYSLLDLLPGHRLRALAPRSRVIDGDDSELTLTTMTAGSSVNLFQVYEVALMLKVALAIDGEGQPQDEAPQLFVFGHSGGGSALQLAMQLLASPAISLVLLDYTHYSQSGSTEYQAGTTSPLALGSNLHCETNPDLASALDLHTADPRMTEVPTLLLPYQPEGHDLATTEAIEAALMALGVLAP